jgi:hypothetical protein
MVKTIHQQGYVGDLVRRKRREGGEGEKKRKIYSVVEISN